MNVGFVGLGRMGQGIAGSVLGGGHALTVFNRTRDKTAELAAAGARVAESVAGACEGADAVLTMVADDAALTDVTLGPDGLRDSLAPGAVHVAMGTHGVAAIQALAAAHAEAGQVMVAAPVLGRPDMAASGQLGIVAAGPPEAVDRCRPLFDVIGRRTFLAGPLPESATAIKLANNFLLGSCIEAMSEAFSLGGAYDVEPQTLFEVLVEGLFSAPAYKVYGEIIVNEDFDRVGFTTELALKDVNLVLAAAGDARMPMPSANLLRDRLLGAIAHGDGERDWAVLAREQERASGRA